MNVILNFEKWNALTEAVINENRKVMPLTISLPYKKDPSTGQMVFDTNQHATIFASNDKAAQQDDHALDPYTNILSLEINNIQVRVFASKKDSAGNITGRFSVSGPENKNLVTYLKTMLGKSLAPGDTSLTVVLSDSTDGSAVALYGANSTYKMYDTAAVKPAATPAAAAKPGATAPVKKN
jgi:hypothetical protein